MNIICDNGILLTLEKYNDRCSKVIIFSKNNGLVQAFLRTPRKSSPHQVYDFLSFRCRCVDNYNYRDLEINTIRSYLKSVFADRLSLSILNSAVSIVNLTLGGRGTGDNVYRLFQNLVFLTEFRGANLLPHYLDFLLNILEFFGINLNASRCYVSGLEGDVYYISPVTGNCVSREVGEKYKQKLFVIPKSFGGYSEDLEDLSAAINIAHHFIYRILFENDMIRGVEIVEMFKKILLKEAEKYYSGNP
ncbi:MAG: hypothetical protein LBI70_01550 [Rickettsiales bacterium]|jgi:recombinational DNA repair protein (RecF pathway)|nr:hypothetical protein [Rickettsiales bacterium]